MDPRLAPRRLHHRPPARCVAGRPRRRPAQRRRLACAGLPRRPALGADPGDRRHRARRVVRRRRAGLDARHPGRRVLDRARHRLRPGRSSPRSCHRGARARRRRLVRPAHGHPRQAPRQGSDHHDVPGLVFVQLDGVARVVFERARRSGDIPTLDRWLRDGSHHVVGWETGWSSQTGVSQCGILHGSVVDMPAFRWVDKDAGTVVVSNRPKSAAAIERAHSDGQGLLAHNGSSYGNLFSGDAERAALTMSNAGKRKEGRVGAGYVGYFSRPQQATRTFIAVVVEVARERSAAAKQRRRGVQPRSSAAGRTRSCGRSPRSSAATCACRACSTTSPRAGRRSTSTCSATTRCPTTPAPSAPTRWPCCATSTTRSPASTGRCSGRPGPTTSSSCPTTVRPRARRSSERNGETLAELVGRLCGGATSGDSDAEQGRTESSAWLRQARDKDGTRRRARRRIPTVLGSGSLGLVTLPGEPRRLTRERDRRAATRR